MEENKDKLAQVYLTVGSIYGEIGDNEKFLEYSEKVYDIKKNDSDEYMMDSLFNIIKSYITIYSNCVIKFKNKITSTIDIP